MLNSDEFADFVKFDEEVARDQLKVTGVPFFVFDQRIALAGAQPREVFLQVMKKALEAPQQTNTLAEDSAICKEDQCDVPEK